MLKSVKRTVLVAAIIAGSLPFAVQAAAPSEANVRVPLMTIEKTSVIDEQTILLELKDKTYRRVDLMAKCPGLTLSPGGYTHRTNTDDWSKYDSIRVNQPGGPTCSINNIVNISQSEATTLLARRD